jgi:retron-type reverse transcriptase
MLFTQQRLLCAWVAYRSGKRRKAAVQAFELRREDELLTLQRELAGGAWRHGAYRSFIVHDPKPRTITAAAVRDRIVHQIVFEEIERSFEKTFLSCSYSARPRRGVHLALDDVDRRIRALRRQHPGALWTIKGDVRKFYDSIDHQILLALLSRRISDAETLRVASEIIASTHSARGVGKGIPIGNITSQVFANVYLHELDRYAIHMSRPAAYFRYADDVLILGTDCEEVTQHARNLQQFASTELALDLALRPARKLSQGVDFLGSVLWPYGRTVRRQTRTRIVARIAERTLQAERGTIGPNRLRATLASYAGIASRVRDRELRRLTMLTSKAE